MPLLLDEWRLLHPASEETVRTFLVKIKHLKSQKEIIKKYLGVSGLLPMGANGENNVPENADTNIAGPIQNGEKTDTIGVIKTESEVNFDFIFLIKVRFTIVKWTSHKSNFIKVDPF